MGIMVSVCGGVEPAADSHPDFGSAAPGAHPAPSLLLAKGFNPAPLLGCFSAVTNGDDAEVWLESDLRAPGRSSWLGVGACVGLDWEGSFGTCRGSCSSVTLG